MRDDDMVTVPKVVRQEGFFDKPAVGVEAVLRWRRCGLIRETSLPVTQMWLQTFDQDPVRVPEEVLNEARGFSRHLEGDTRERSYLVAIAPVWTALPHVGPLTKRFLSLFLPEESVNTPPKELCNGIECNKPADYMFNGNHYCEAHYNFKVHRSAKQKLKEVTAKVAAGLTEGKSHPLHHPLVGSGDRKPHRMEAQYMAPPAPGANVDQHIKSMKDALTDGMSLEEMKQRREGHEAKLARQRAMTRLERVAAGLEQDPYMVAQVDMEERELYESSIKKPDMAAGYKPLAPIVDDMSGDDL